MPISRARTIAFDVLARVAKQDAYADEVLRAELAESVRTEDAGLATELTLGVLRWQRLLDFAIDRSLTKVSKALDIEVRIALRMGAYQLLFLDRIPARAAVHESVELVKRSRKRSASALVNAVLRNVAKQPLPGNSPPEAVAQLVTTDDALADRLGIQYSHPTWMVERWFRIYGEEKTRSLLQANNRVPTLSGYLLDPQRREGATVSLQQVGCGVQQGQLLREAWLLEAGNPGASEAVRYGWVSIQDEASQAVARLLAPDPGNTVLDLCAAPGGKTLLLSRAAGAQGCIVAADLHENRVRAMHERLELAGVRNVRTIVLNGEQPLPSERPFDRLFDRILVDVPCSGTGTLARHPEIRWKLRAEDLRDLHDRQARLLRNALPHLAPSGRLVYSTCSLEPEENELVVRQVLGDLGDTFQIADPRSAIEGFLRESVRIPSLVAEDNFFRTFPAEHGTDGFFAAVIERRNPNA
ncbi:MAG TPA: 16S rRNA (cytosine(967)-C(5))-methyltransferase RsmB [Candidatus Acidoferrales bacterium]|jgi:16S rRNA (cytosine967-C5)-methyltransferase|nr:16S rRNA (cytosine(967)-C(5))-methyltransferase RsmB [Candidatus Acidoferrales bacterium]